ncbi:MAG TPA: hypothetical protein VEK84_08450, partial [Terriglobales bacterium]|nr:hypothetical protein [Terriglobales bacterium]
MTAFPATGALPLVAAAGSETFGLVASTVGLAAVPGDGAGVTDFPATGALPLIAGAEGETFGLVASTGGLAAVPGEAGATAPPGGFAGLGGTVGKRSARISA